MPVPTRKDVMENNSFAAKIMVANTVLEINSTTTIKFLDLRIDQLKSLLRAIVENKISSKQLVAEIQILTAELLLLNHQLAKAEAKELANNYKQNLRDPDTS